MTDDAIDEDDEFDEDDGPIHPIWVALIPDGRAIAAFPAEDEEDALDMANHTPNTEMHRALHLDGKRLWEDLSTPLRVRPATEEEAKLWHEGYEADPGLEGMGNSYSHPLLGVEE